MKGTMFRNSSSGSILISFCICYLTWIIYCYVLDKFGIELFFFFLCLVVVLFNIFSCCRCTVFLTVYECHNLKANRYFLITLQKWMWKFCIMGSKYKTNGFMLVVHSINSDTEIWWIWRFSFVPWQALAAPHLISNFAPSILKSTGEKKTLKTAIITSRIFSVLVINGQTQKHLEKAKDWT